MRNDEESVAYLLHSFPSTTSTTTLDHHYLHSLRVSDPLIHTMDTLQHSYFSGPAVFAQNAPSSLSPELDCLSFPSGPSLPLLAQNSYPTPPHQGLQSLHHIVPLSGPPIGSFPTQSTTHTSILDASARSGTEFEAICASLSEEQLIKSNNLAYFALKEKLMVTQAALNESRCVSI
jgi:hypothetical protein